MIRSLSIITLFFLLSISVRADFRTNVHFISRSEGLSNGAVNVISKDSEGYIWFGTWNGLNRYDGSTMLTYLPGSNFNSIHNHVIRELYPTTAGPIWILTNKGVSLYDNVYGRFTSYFTRESEQINYEDDITICHSDSYGTMASVFGRGIFRFDTTARQFNQIIFDENSQTASLGIKRIHLFDREAYCISGNGTLFLLSDNHLNEIMKLPLTGTMSSSISVSINERPFLLITQRTGATLMVDLEGKTVQQLSIPDDVITSFAHSKLKERIWVGTEKGKIYSFNLLTRKFEIFNILSGLFVVNPIETRILSIYESDTDILWIGTDGNGVYALKLIEFPNKSLASNQLSYPIVRSILVTRTGNVLIGTKGGGIDIFDSNGNYLRKISVKDGLSNSSVLSFHEHGNGTIWVGTDGKGIDIISPDFKKIRNFPRDFKSTNSLEFASVYCIIEDSDHRIYLGTSGYGVIRIDLDQKTQSLPESYEQLILDKSISSPGLQKQIVYTLAIEKPGVIWIGTRGLGVYRYNTITKREVEQYSITSHPNLIRNDDIICLLSGKNIPLLVGSSNGIFSLIPVSSDSVKAAEITFQSDLYNTSIHAMQLDNLQNLWLTTNQGISMIDSSRKNTRFFNTNDGLINVEYSDGASFFDTKTNRLYIGGTMGVDIIQTDQIKYTSYFPPVALNQLFIKNIPVEPATDGVLTSRINHQGKLNLEYNQNSITFDVAPLAIWGQERHRISYRLKNFDKEWITKPQNQPINYSNLPADKYLLQIRASDENGNWSKDIREIEIIINPPFWLTTWAIICYLLIFIGIQYLIFAYYRSRAARKKELALQEFKMKNEDELHKLKIEFFTNIAHEFRTPLTVITSHIHALLEKTQNTTENPRLVKVYNNSIKIQKLVLEIMQFRKLEKGKEPLNIQQTRPDELVREVISDLELFAQQRNISCELISPEPEHIFKTDTDKFQRIVTNLISNAIKYNNARGCVNVSLKYNQSGLCLEVEDDGLGINKELSQKVFEPFGISSILRQGSFPGYRSTGIGLAVTKGLVELLKGTIDFESESGKGTKFTCNFPDVHQVNQPEYTNRSPGDLDEISFMQESDLEMPVGEPELNTGKSMILIVDDDPEILTLLKDFLQADYNLLFAENGLEAFDKAVAEKPDLIVSDVMMPVMDGIELCNNLRENFDMSHLPIILLTAKAEIEDRILGLRAGADSYIPKPFHPEHLKIRIEKLLQFRSTVRKNFGIQESNSTQIKEIPDPFFQKMLNFIDENLDDEALSSETLCDKLGISKSSLYNKTRSVLGITPHSLINQRRLSKSAMLLKSTTLTVSEIIDQTGFVSRTYFYDLFNKAYGCPPSDYRNKSVVS